MQNVLEMAVLRESASQEITYLLTYLVSQTKCGRFKCRNSAIFQMTILMHMNVYERLWSIIIITHAHR